MADSYLQNLFAARIGGKEYGKSTAIYKFEKIKRAKRAALAAHPNAEILDLGVGEPDEMAFPEVVAQLAQEAAKPENRGYSDNGDDFLKGAAARYLDKVCGCRELIRKPKSSIPSGARRRCPFCRRLSLTRRLCAHDDPGIRSLAHTRNITADLSINFLCWSATVFCPIWIRFRRTSCARAKCWC